MIEITYTDAVDAIFGQFNNVWTDGRVLALLGYDTEVRWQGVEREEPPTYDKFWCRVSQSTVDEGQRTLSNCAGIVGQSRFGTVGIVIIQLFCPRDIEKSMELGRELAKIARSAFRSKRIPNTGIIFRHARIKELDPEFKLNRFNIVAEYEYDELA